MARQRKPENETIEESRVRQLLESIANNADRSEKTSWNRKFDNMVKLIATLSPIEKKIMELTEQKFPIMDDINDLRLIMVKECVHPFDHLTYFENHIRCKFCDRKISVPREFDGSSEEA
jgi:hypothetical protein